MVEGKLIKTNKGVNGLLGLILLQAHALLDQFSSFKFLGIFLKKFSDLCLLIHFIVCLSLFCEALIL